MPEARRVLFLLADGARADVLEELLGRGKLPSLQQVYAPNKEPVRRAATTMPSATGPAYLPFLTGRFAGPLNVPGIRWFDRFAYVNKARFQAKRSYVGLGHRYLDRDLDPDLKTIFVHEPDHVNIFNPVRRGVRADRNRLQAARAFLSPWAKYFHGWRLLDRSVERATLKAVDSGAKFVFSTFMGIDENSHDYGVRNHRTIDAYRFLDEAFGKVVQGLQRRHELEKTRVIVSSDHGLSDTSHHFPLAEFVQEHGYRTIYYPKIWRRNPRAAVMVSGNAMAHLYLQKRGSWAYRPRGSSLWAEHGELLAALAMNDSVAFVAYRDDEGSIVAQKGEDRTRFRSSDGRIKFETVGRDPLGFPTGMRMMDEQYYLDYSWGREYPDAVVQLSQLFESPRAGDVIVFARPGHDLRGHFEFPEHKASHGSLHRDHLLVPLLINDAEVGIGPCRTADAFVYMMRTLGHLSRQDLDGRELPRAHPPSAPPIPVATPAPAPAEAPVGVAVA